MEEKTPLFTVSTPNTTPVRAAIVLDG